MSVLSILPLLGLCLTQPEDTLPGVVAYAVWKNPYEHTEVIKVPDHGSFTDLFLRNPGMTVADNGGLAGLKTLDIRGMGTSNTSILIDGIRVENVQNGQPDLGMFSLSNFRSAVIDYSRNSVDFITDRPLFYDGPVSGRFGCDAGSFSTWLPYGKMDFRLSKDLSLSAFGAGMFSKGDYECSDGVFRQNNDITRVSGGMDIFGSCWSAKLWCSDADRGTPGSLSWPSEDRQHDRNYLAQGNMRVRSQNGYVMTLSTKASLDGIDYVSDQSTTTYVQKGLQVNSTHDFRVASWLRLVAREEFHVTDLRSSVFDAFRTSALVSANAKFGFQRLQSSFSYEYSGTFDRDALSCNVFSPSLRFKYYMNPLSKGWLNLVGYVRRSFRTPTFNELYFPGFGNPELKPEDAFLSNLGLEFKQYLSSSWWLETYSDVYFNKLSDKITSAPSKDDPGKWMPYNISVVRAFGADAQFSANYKVREFKSMLNVKYSFSQADGVPYLSKHIFVIVADVSWGALDMNAVWNYHGGRRDSYGDMPDWNTMDLFISRSFNTREIGVLTLKASFRNIFDNRYELVTDYPMQGRNFLFGAEIKF
ncbi:MAG: TonB-dependent receptor plug domain-containing protein [Bacteroidales bacterium]|nr:TonB-dependent receptor plug domain-containing protein [Bacteroidales bacterium]